MDYEENPPSAAFYRRAKAIHKLLKKHKKAWTKKWVKARMFAGKGLTAKQVKSRIERGTLKPPKKTKAKAKKKKKKAKARRPQHISKVASKLLKAGKARTWRSAMRKAGKLRKKKKK